MRELLYLSTKKLGTFLPAWPSLSVRAAGSAGVGPVSVTVDVSAALPAGFDEATIKAFRRVVGHLEREAGYFTSPDLEAGQWIFFDVKMGYGTVYRDTGLLAPEDDVALFYGSYRASEPDGQVSTDLLLCGSTEHLRQRTASAGRMGSGSCARLGEAGAGAGTPASTCLGTWTGKAAAAPGGYLSCDATADARDRLRVTQPGDPGGRVLTAADWLETRVRLQDSTRRIYRSHIRLHLRRLFDGVLLSGLHVSHVETAFRRLFNGDDSGDGAAPVLDAVRERVIGDNPARYVKPPGALGRTRWCGPSGGPRSGSVTGYGPQWSCGPGRKGWSPLASLRRRGRPG